MSNPRSPGITLRGISVIRIWTGSKSWLSFCLTILVLSWYTCIPKTGINTDSEYSTFLVVRFTFLGNYFTMGILVFECVSGPLIEVLQYRDFPITYRSYAYQVISVAEHAGHLLQCTQAGIVYICYNFTSKCKLLSHRRWCQSSHVYCKRCTLRLYKGYSWSYRRMLYFTQGNSKV